jgi:hypothetical protein
MNTFRNARNPRIAKMDLNILLTLLGFEDVDSASEVEGVDELFSLMSTWISTIWSRPNQL